jgi:hypothetical protein
MMQAGSFAENVRLFSSAPHFRSASVDELVLEDDFFRRPLRPEDLDFLDFDRPVREDTFDALSSLMSQRILLSINEGEEILLPSVAPANMMAWESFYSDNLRELGRQLASALETHAFAFLTENEPARSGEPFSLGWEEAQSFWQRQHALLAQAGYGEAGLRFILTQHVPLHASVVASGRHLPSQIIRLLAGGSFATTTVVLSDRMRKSGLRTGRHSYWQFYLPGSMALANILYQLGRSPLTLLRYIGARLVLEVDRAALRQTFCGGDDDGSGDARGTVSADARRVLTLLTDCFGPQAAARAAAGAATMRRLLSSARSGLAEQLVWLSDLRWAQRAAQQISERIERDLPDIDRDTFVEPREMCSTTHVHDEHRLVVIDTGHMQFWGNVGMRHDMYPGDMILVPRGRLHGSTVLSDSCTYHQPIIPNEWRKTIPAWTATT